MDKYQVYILTVINLLSLSNIIIGAPIHFKNFTAASSKWSDAGDTTVARLYQEASSLIDGKILFTGTDGYESCATTEFYDPLTKKWTLGTDMNDCRWYHTSTLLKDGKVLVAGGYIEDPRHGKTVKYTLDGAELFDPATRGWTHTGSLHQERHSHTASMLPNGKVLVTGGMDVDFLASAELYDPSTRNWSLTDSMHCKRVWHTVTMLNNGKVLVTGGMNDASGDAALTTAELYDLSTEKWKNVSSMHYPRYGHTATILTNGKVLVVGGVDLTFSSINSAELFDPFTETWTVTGSMFNTRSKHTASLLRNGKVLVAGGGTSGEEVFPGFDPLNTAEIYDPSTGLWTNTSSMHYTRTWHTASVLEDGNILVVGGRVDSEYGVSSSELYNSSTGTYIPLSELKKMEYLHKDFTSMNEVMM